MYRVEHIEKVPVAIGLICIGFQGAIFICIFFRMSVLVSQAQACIKIRVLLNQRAVDYSAPYFARFKTAEQHPLRVEVI